MGYGLCEEVKHKEGLLVPKALFEEIRDVYIDCLGNDGLPEDMCSVLQSAGSLKEFQNLAFSWFKQQGKVFFDEDPPQEIILLHAIAFAEAMGILLKKESNE